jgi:hypothetical protein
MRAVVTCRRVQEGKSAGMGAFKCGKRGDAMMLTTGFQDQLARRNKRTFYIQARQKPETVLACPLSHGETVNSDRQKVTTPGIVKLADEQSRGGLEFRKPARNGASDK